MVVPRKKLKSKYHIYATNFNFVMTDHIIQPETGHIYITPTGFLVYAQNFYSAAIKWETDGNYSPVPYFLFCRSIELGLKAFVLAKGEKMEVVKLKIRHNIDFALEKALNYSLADFLLTTEEEKKELQKANIYYNDKGFEYFNIKNLFGKNDLLELEILKQYSEKLLKEIKPFIISTA